MQCRGGGHLLGVRIFYMVHCKVFPQKKLRDPVALERGSSFPTAAKMFPK